MLIFEAFGLPSYNDEKEYLNKYRHFKFKLAVSILRDHCHHHHHHHHHPSLSSSAMCEGAFRQIGFFSVPSHRHLDVTLFVISPDDKEMFISRRSFFVQGMKVPAKVEV
jgi:hypothetical protein